MDILSVIGVLLALGAIIGGNFIEGGHLSALVNVSAVVIVFGGTVGAACLQTPWRTMRRCLRIAIWVFNPPSTRAGALLEDILLWSNIARREGLLGLEAIAEQQSDRFFQKGLQMLVDGSEPAVLREAMESEIYLRLETDMAAAGVFEAMGGYAPTVGILGAVMGLIHVMSHLADPSKLGAGIATAFVATIYGVGSANLFFLPFASKIKSQVQQRAQYMDMLVEGLVAISDGENPRNIELRLQSYLAQER